MKNLQTNNPHGFLLPLTVRNPPYKNYIVYIDLPMQNDLLDRMLSTLDMIDDEGDNYVVDCIQHPLLKKLEGTVVNMHALNYLAKRLYRFDLEELNKFNGLLNVLEPSSIEEMIDISYNLNIVDISQGCIKYHTDSKVKGLDAVVETLYQADQGEEFFMPWLATISLRQADDMQVIVDVPFRKEGFEFLNNNYSIQNMVIEDTDEAKECVLPFTKIYGFIDFKKFNEMTLKMSESNFDTRKWRTYTDEYEPRSFNEFHYLCYHLDELIYDDNILSLEDYGVETLFRLYRHSRKDFDRVVNQFDVNYLGKQMCEVEHTTCTANGLITSKEEVMKGLHEIQRFQSQKEVIQLRTLYPKGTRIRLIHMTDIQAMESSVTGTVDMVDDIGQIHMKWDNGRSLALIPGEDKYEIISKPEEKQEEGMEML